MTHGMRLAAFCWVVVLHPPLSYSTERLNEAERRLAESQNKYFDALVQGPRKSFEESQLLKNKIVTPAYNEVNRVLNEQNKAFASQFLNLMSPEQYQRELEFADRQETHSSMRDKPIHGLGEFVQTLFGGEDSNRSLAGSPTQGSGSDYSTGGGNQGAGGASKKPQVVIDGRVVPKMIQFPGPKKTPSGD